MPGTAFLLVLDGVGAGALPDAGAYGDEGADTLGNLSRAVGRLDLPFLGSLGLGNLHPVEGVAPVPEPAASWGRMMERSAGKDSTTGHWELMGLS
ncbi:phosphopentomutase, partial [Candidatus Fermentibacteria bacterium]|nr:phosphopentomutase [Candidatus Fermentibacteria bacterium]